MSVATRQDCAWSVGGAGDWLTLLSSAASTGPGTLDYAVAANGGAARDKTLTVAGLAFTVRQDGAVLCTFAIDPERREFTSNGGGATVAVTAQAGCAWTAASGVPWIVITGQADGRGNGAVSYTVAENNTTAARTGTIAVAGRTHTVEQRAEATPLCEYRVSPVEFGPCMPSGSASATVTTADSCRWTATSGASWLTITGGRSGTGSGTISFAWTDNYLAPRQGVVMVRWSAPTLGQNLQIAQAGCTYGVSRAAIDMPAAGGVASFDVLQQSVPYTCGGPLQDGCVWTARSDVSWIVVSTAMPRRGDDRVTLTVAVNTGAARTGRVTVGDQTVTITQAAP